MAAVKKWIVTRTSDGREIDRETGTESQVRANVERANKHLAENTPECKTRYGYKPDPNA